MYKNYQKKQSYVTHAIKSRHLCNYARMQNKTTSRHVSVSNDMGGETKLVKTHTHARIRREYGIIIQRLAAIA